MEVTRVFKWHAAHNLCLPYSSKCTNLHGHTYRVEITFAGPLNKEGMVVDFGEIEEIGQEVSFDHQLVNDIPYFRENNPTAENMVLYLKQEIEKLLEGTGYEDEVYVKQVKVWETDNSYAVKRWKRA